MITSELKLELISFDFRRFIADYHMCGESAKIVK